MQSKYLSIIFHLADGGIMSYKVKSIKPQKKIYQTLLQTYNLKPETCFFIDNKKRMVDGAKALGIDGIVCTDHNHVIETLKKLNIL